MIRKHPHRSAVQKGRVTHQSLMAAHAHLAACAVAASTGQHGFPFGPHHHAHQLLLAGHPHPQLQAHFAQLPALAPLPAPPAQHGQAAAHKNAHNRSASPANNGNSGASTNPPSATAAAAANCLFAAGTGLGHQVTGAHPVAAAAAAMATAISSMQQSSGAKGKPASGANATATNNATKQLLLPSAQTHANAAVANPNQQNHHSNHSFPMHASPNVNPTTSSTNPSIPSPVNNEQQQHQLNRLLASQHPVAAANAMFAHLNANSNGASSNSNQMNPALRANSMAVSLMAASLIQHHQQQQQQQQAKQHNNALLANLPNHNNHHQHQTRDPHSTFLINMSQHSQQQQQQQNLMMNLNMNLNSAAQSVISQQLTLVQQQQAGLSNSNLAFNYQPHFGAATASQGSPAKSPLVRPWES